VNRRTLALPALLGLALIPWAAGAALGPRYGGELAVAVAELPESLEPGVPRGAAEGLLAALVHETLVAGGPDGVPVPRLARGWASGAGGREWTLRLAEGAAFHDGKPVTAIEAARSLRRFLRAAGAAPAVLVGHSMGGAIAQAVALAQPDALRGLALVGTGARLRVHPKIFEALRRDPAEAARMLVEWGFGPAAPQALRADGARDLLRCPPEVIEGDFRACDAFEVMAEVGRIRLPTLVVCGEQDVLTPPKYARFLHHQIPGSRLALVPDAGHYVMREQPAAVNAALAEFLGALP